MNPTSAEDTGASGKLLVYLGVPPGVFDPCVWHRMIVLILGSRDGDRNRGRGGCRELRAESLAIPQRRHDVDVSLL